MQSTENMDSRLRRVDMHDYFISRINKAIEDDNYIEATWLIYACLENRYYRMLIKYRENCKYCRSKSKCNKTNKNELAIATKIKCVRRLYDAGVTCITEAFSHEIFDDTLKWVDNRNTLMHELLSLEYYENMDELFKESAVQGLDILATTYKSCTKFRKLFYDADFIFEMPDCVSDGCACKPRKEEKNE